ncbi:amino acid ABC transporter permease [Collinsella sp. AGMB00827]|uniref:Amino acid ABC transporter permease n=1 Tax=Collinsella ureilytica TaxID=2869515 RepID=A0ABS7MKH1_9ACTN|nr:amino acid ABC transporter permease [Collinsella urealyticum]MBY4797767.1 amino acid ABC transporter permease [Collinsella urealyticum]
MDFSMFTAANVSFIMNGFLKTVQISALAIICSLILGTVLAMVKQYATGKLRPLSWLASMYIELFRCTPNLLWILFIYFTVKGSDLFISVLAFTIFTSAVMAEIVRGGFNSVPKSQFEATQSQGFGFFAAMRYVILPQTFKKIIPALFSQCTTVIKDSSYLAGVNVAEFMYSSRVVMAQTSDLGGVLTLYGFVFAMYFILNFSISLIVRAYQRRQVAA